MMPRLLLTVCAVACSTSAMLLAAEPNTQPQFADWIAELNSDNFDIREAATKALIASDDAAAPALQAALKKSTDAELTSRISDILKVIRNNHPERVLKLSLECAHDMVLEVGADVIPAKLWIENVSDAPVEICLPVAGCMDELRAVAYQPALFNSVGKALELDQDAIIHDADVPFNESDFVTLTPGQKTEVLGREGDSGRVRLRRFMDVVPGKYSLKITYRVPGIRPHNQELFASDRARALLDSAFKCTLTSPPVTLNITPAPSIEDLLAMIEKGDLGSLESWRVFEAVRDAGNNRSLPVLCRALKNGDIRFRIGAAKALTTPTDSAKRGPLLDSLKDANPGVRQFACYALVNVADDAVVKALIAAIPDEDHCVRFAASHALKKITQYEVPLDFKTKDWPGTAAKWTEWWQKNGPTFDFEAARKANAAADAVQDAADEP
jgi:hypothetical protein